MKTIVITGCSSGFGRITALELLKRGWHVFATVRKEADRENLLTEATGSQGRLTPLLCDITRSDEIATLAREVEAILHSSQDEKGNPPHLHALLNNAGTAYAAPVELLPIDDLRQQMEINFIAHVEVTQAFLPLLKAAQGTIINVSSVNGRIATPAIGAYAASKFALEAICDVLRVELAPFGVRVVAIEPSSSPTSIWQTSIDRSLDKLEKYRDGPYARLLSVTERVAKRSARTGFPPQLFADTVVKILNTRNPRARYPIPGNISRMILLRRILPDRLWDRMIRRAIKW